VTPGDDVLTSADQAMTISLIDDAVPESGALRFDNDTIELYAGGEFRTILEDAGVPARVVVTREEAIPSQSDPIFCRIKNRSFFALKVPEPLPAAVLNLDGRLKASTSATLYAGYAGRVGYVAIPRDHLAIATARSAEDFAQAPASLQLGSGLKAGGSFALRGAARAPIDYAMPLAARLVAPALNFRQLGGVAPWRFALAHHPQSIELLRAIAVGMTRLYTRETEADPRAATSSLTIPFDFKADYQPDPSWVDVNHLPVDALEFKVDQASSNANWELLFHSAMSVSQQLMRTGDHDGARRWITYVFNPRDPAARDAGGAVHPENYWVFKPFHDFVQGTAADDFANLDPNGTQDRYLAAVFRGLIRQWRENPYNPHAVAAFRPQAYQLATIFLYVENLIAWGDSLLAIPSDEAVKESASHYEEADRVIGRQPRSTGAIRYDESALRAYEVDDDFALGSASIENGFSLGDGPSPNIEDAFLPDLALWYFCLPPNPKIRELRERVQDRLFKVHHCLDLLGNPRQLPLYDPPIDPALLADAAMAGLNVSQAVMDAYTPRPHYRFRTLLGIAKGLVQQASALGSGLLAAMEKQDAESLSLLKSTHESKILERASTIRRLQVEDAQASIKALEGTVTTVEARREYYSSREFMNAEETSQIILSIASTIFRTVGQSLNVAASAASAVPDFTLGGAGFGGSPVAVTKTGGENVRRVPAGLGQAMEFVGEFMSTLAGVAGSMGSYRRRKEDWNFQAKSAALELKQLNAQILGAQIRQTIAERELANHEAQLEQSRDELEFVRTKQTAVNLYEWLAADIGASYYRAFQLAHSFSLQVQRAYQDELASTRRFIGYSQWDGTRKGLQAGEKLMQDLVEMETEYYAQNARPGVKSITVSLALVDPIALAELKMNGRCSFVLSEAFWNKHAPRLYHRRFSSVAMSVPAVAGPYSGVHGRVSIEHARYRKEPTLLGDPTDDPADRYDSQDNDTRFVEQFPRPGDYVLLSTGVRDTGLGSEESREDRYPPFANLGVESAWTVEISQRDNTLLDIASIADFVMHCEIAGRDGGAELEEAARASVARQSPSQGLQLSMRQQFAGEWQRLKAGESATLQLPLQLLAELSKGKEFVTLSVAVLLRVKQAPATANIDLQAPADAIAAGVASPVSFVLDVAADPTEDGGTRYAFAQQDVVVEGGTIQLAYESLWAEAWKLTVTSGDPTGFEDLVIAMNFVLKEGP
jgi:hypothetical protein